MKRLIKRGLTGLAALVMGLGISTKLNAQCHEELQPDVHTVALWHFNEGYSEVETLEVQI